MTASTARVYTAQDLASGAVQQDALERLHSLIAHQRHWGSVAGMTAISGRPPQRFLRAR
jgi:hypothetical protein